MAEKQQSLILSSGQAHPSTYPTMDQMPEVEPVQMQVGPYEMICKLGSGGMGTVYVAKRVYEETVSRTVVIKTLRADLQQRPALVEMFLNEARIAARIQHPYVCAVTDVGYADGIPYVAMEYLMGEPLSRLIPLLKGARGETAIACTVKIVADLCEGLHAAHELRDEEGNALHVVHRDVSPDNLFVMYDGTVRVMDFGIASTAELQKTQKGSFVGKWGYMSPEQLKGDALDRRADIWAMGVVLWEFLTGRRLFQRASDVRAAIAVLSDPIALPSELNPMVPKNLDAVVMRALARDRDRRYATAREFAQALDAVLTKTLAPVSPAKLGRWLDALFPGRLNFWRRIVVHSRELVEVSGPVPVPAELRGRTSLEFDPLAPPPLPPALLRDEVSSSEAAPEVVEPLLRTPRTLNGKQRALLGGVLGLGLLAGALALVSPRTSQRRERHTLPVASAMPTASPVQAPAPAAVVAPAPNPVLATPEPEPVEPAPVEPKRAAPRAHDEDEEASERARAGRGQVYVVTADKDVWVSFNGRESKAPTVLELPAGKQLVMVRHEGIGTTAREVVVVPGKPTVLNLNP